MQQAGEALLAQSLIGQHRHGVAEVQTPGRGDHGQADAAVIVGQAERLRQARRLLAEKQPAPLPEPGLAVVLRGLGGGQPQVLRRLIDIIIDDGDVKFVFGGEFDIVTYVPVSKKRKQERGYDQSYLLARETCRHWSVAPETLLQKTKDNVAQSSLSSREERQKNVVGAYVAVNEDKIKGQRILLIDDILTTGATLREAARVLREAGAEKVICATLAAADED